MKRSVEPDFKFDKDKFGEALMAAIGTRTVAQFSKDAEISYAYLSKYKNLREDKTPTPQTLKKIALVSQGPSYKELLEAAGYDSNKYEDDDISATMVNSEWSPMNTLLPTLCRTSFKWQFVSDGTAGAPLCAKIEGTPFESWYFIPVTKDNVTKEDILGILGSKEAEVISSDSKVTFLTANEDVYKKNMEQYPQFQTAIDQLHDSAPEYAGALLSVFPEARQIVETEIENMINDKQTPQEAVDQMADQINKAIEDYNTLNE